MADSGLTICPLASGSAGNAVYVEGGGHALLVDAGLSGVEIERRMAKRGLKPDSLSAVVVTHEHTDHIKGAGILSRRYGIPVHINPKTLEAAGEKLGKLDRMIPFQCGQSFRINGITINPFSISHDAADPAGFTLERDGVKVGMATDLGVTTNLVREHLKECSLLYLEANHDPEMLMNGPYPWYLKQRILSERGHLSNDATVELLGDIANGQLRHLFASSTASFSLKPFSTSLKVESLSSMGISSTSFLSSSSTPDKTTFLFRFSISSL